MARKSGKQDTNEDRNMSGMKGKLEDDVDALFKLPLAEFTAARNNLAARLKQSGRGDEAVLVKSLVKPSISAWAVNQLYWQHRESFNRLIATGERFRQAQTSRASSKVADMRGALDARREVLADLSELATGLLQDSHHNPTLDTRRRITTSLEAMSAYGSVPDAPQPGRLTDDVDPPGFESLASWVPAAGMKERTASQKPGPGAASMSTKAERAAEARQLEASRQSKLADAKAALQEAKRLLTDIRAKQKSLDAAQKKAQTAATEAEKQRREAEQRFNKAKAVAEDAAQRARSIKTELSEGSKELKDAERAVEKASKELELLFRESPGK